MPRASSYLFCSSWGFGFLQSPRMRCSHSFNRWLLAAWLRFVRTLRKRRGSSCTLSRRSFGTSRSLQDLGFSDVHILWFVSDLGALHPQMSTDATSTCLGIRGRSACQPRLGRGLQIPGHQQHMYIAESNNKECRIDASRICHKTQQLLRRSILTFTRISMLRGVLCRCSIVSPWPTSQARDAA